MSNGLSLKLSGTRKQFAQRCNTCDKGLLRCFSRKVAATLSSSHKVIELKRFKQDSSPQRIVEESLNLALKNLFDSGLHQRG